MNKISYIFTLLKKLRLQENGVTVIEYTLIATFIAVVLVASLTSIGTGLKTTLSTVATGI